MNNMIEKGQQYIMGTYSQAPIVIEKGEGVYLTDNTGKKYIDMVSGIAVNSLGYRHPAIVKAIQEQAETLIHISNLYWNIPQIELAEKLCKASGLGKAFFCNSGAEANESAIKLARKYGNGRSTIISMIQSFHGRTLGALKATGQTKYQNGFAPLPEGFKYTEANNIEMLDQMIDDDTCAIMLEVIQGEAGIIALDEAYLKHVESICQQKDILFIVDEVQTGMGRTGYAFAHQKFDLHPDIVTMAKAIAGGVPMGAMLAKDHVAAAFNPGDHASTFGGNPLAAHTACAVADIIFDDTFLAQVQEKGEYFAKRLAECVDGEKVLEVRGRGLMLGLLLDDSVKPGDIVSAAAESGLLICTAGKQVLRFVPPLVISKDEIDEAIEILKKVLA
ncbi:MAG: acetylornithine transaminase [Peptococcaceae bacterium]|nr:acetylornithine transaminase [Peptococcaceae bacterium]